MRFTKIAPALLLAALIGGCDSNPTEPTAEIDAALSLMATGGIATYSARTTGPLSGQGVSVPIPDGSSASSCAYDSATQFFVCAPITANGITLSRQFQLMDASGAKLSTIDPLLIASIRSIIDVEGTHTMAATNAPTIQIDRHEDATLSGIQSTNRVLNGTATQQVTGTGSFLMLSIDETSATTNLILPSSPDQKYPLGGTIVTNGTLTSAVSAGTTTTPYQGEISFDGTSIMTVKLTTNGSTSTCKVNLANSGSRTCT